MAQWIAVCGLRLTPLAQALKEFILSQSVVHADKKPLAPGQGKTKKAYVWVYRTTNFALQRVVFYDFRMRPLRRASAARLARVHRHAGERRLRRVSRHPSTRRDRRIVLGSRQAQDLRGTPRPPRRANLSQHSAPFITPSSTTQGCRSPDGYFLRRFQSSEFIHSPLIQGRLLAVLVHIKRHGGIL